MRTFWRAWGNVDCRANDCSAIAQREAAGWVFIIRVNLRSSSVCQARTLKAAAYLLARATASLYVAQLNCAGSRNVPNVYRLDPSLVRLIMTSSFRGVSSDDERDISVLREAVVRGVAHVDIHVVRLQYRVRESNS